MTDGNGSASPDQKDRPAQTAKPVEKTVGWGSRVLLSIAATAKGIARIIKEDSQKSRTAFWAYAGVIGIIAPAVLVLGFIPGPNLPGVLLGVSSAYMFVGAVKGLASIGVSNWAKEKNERHLKDLFNGKALVKRYDAFIHPKKNDPEKFYVNKRELLAYTFNRASTDVDHVSPQFLRNAAAFVKNRMVMPVMNGLSAAYNAVAGKKAEDPPKAATEKSAEKEPEQTTPQAQPPSPAV